MSISALGSVKGKNSAGADLPERSEETAREEQERRLQIGQRESAVHRQALDLVEHVEVRGIHRGITTRAAVRSGGRRDSSVRYLDGRGLAPAGGRRRGYLALGPRRMRRRMLSAKKLWNSSSISGPSTGSEGPEDLQDLPDGPRDRVELPGRGESPREMSISPPERGRASPRTARRPRRRRGPRRGRGSPPARTRASPPRGAFRDGPWQGCGPCARGRRSGRPRGRQRRLRRSQRVASTERTVCASSPTAHSRAVRSTTAGRVRRGARQAPRKGAPAAGAGPRETGRGVSAAWSRSALHPGQFTNARPRPVSVNHPGLGGSAGAGRPTPW